jgi:predicted GTPase
MPYGHLEAMRPAFATLAEIDDAPDHRGAGGVRGADPHGHGHVRRRDYGAILRQAEQEADVVIWDGGNNDFPFVGPDLLIVLAEPLRPVHELLYHPGETILRMADVVVINKVDSAEADNVEQVLENIESVNPMATVVFAKSPPVLDAGPELLGKYVLVIDDGPTLTHGGMPFGVPAARTPVRRRSSTRGCPRSARSRTHRQVASAHQCAAGDGYDEHQLAELEASINATDVVVTGTPIDLGRLITSRHPIRHALCRRSVPQRSLTY